MLKKPFAFHLWFKGFKRLIGIYHAVSADFFVGRKQIIDKSSFYQLSIRPLSVKWFLCASFLFLSWLLYYQKKTVREDKNDFATSERRFELTQGWGCLENLPLLISTLIRCHRRQWAVPWHMIATLTYM